MKLTLNELGQLLKNESDNFADHSFYGVVESEITDLEDKVIGYNVTVGDSEIEARKLAGANVGDIVLITTLSNGVSVVTGALNGDADAMKAKEDAEEAKGIAEDAADAVEEIEGTISDIEEAARQAQEDAEEAAEAANSVKQYFFHDEEEGTHITTEEDDAEHGYNALLKAGGIFFRNALLNLMSLTAAALTFFNNQGKKLMQLTTYALEFFDGSDEINSVAKFSGTGTRVGKETQSHINLEDSDFSIWDGNINLMDVNAGEATTRQKTRTGTVTYAYPNQINFNSPVPESTIPVTIDNVLVHTFTAGVTESYQYVFDGVHTLGIYNYPTKIVFSPVGSWTTSTSVSFSIEWQEYDVNFQYTLGTRDSTKSKGMCSTVIGDNCFASGAYSYACGLGSSASAAYATALGYSCTAEEMCSLSQGMNNVNKGYCSQTFGQSVSAGGDYCTVAGQGLSAQYDNQTVFGKFNRNNANNILEVGNGTSSGNKSNALALSTAGELTLAGHSSPIGTVLTADGSQTKASSTDYAYISGATVTLYPGTWIISYSVYCDLDATNKTLRGRLQNTTSNTEYNSTRAIVHTSSTAAAAITGTLPITLDELSIIRVYAAQNSGSAKSISAYIRAARIA